MSEPRQIRVMRQHRQQRLHEITAVFLGLSLAVVLTTTVYAHLWLGQYSPQGSADLATVFTDTVEQEQSVMEDLRLFGAVGSVMIPSLGIYLVSRYVPFVRNPRWETKKALAVCLFFNITGIVFFTIVSGLLLDAVYLTLVALTGVGIVGTGSSILLTGDTDDGDETTTDDLPRCPECGTVDSGEHPYCPECGQEL